MNYDELVELGLNGDDKLKVILSGYVESADDSKTGVVSMVFATEERELAWKKLNELRKEYPDRYFMVYSVPLNTDLKELSHYPSIAIEKSDLE